MGFFPRNKARQFCLVILAVFMLLFSVSSVFAEESSITGYFNGFGYTVPWEYSWSEDYFRLPPEEYNHDLAKLSLGMALAAFRDEFHPENPADLLIDFFEKLGFEQIETVSFNTPPTSYSISYGFAQLKRSDMTVVAVAVCGGNYGAEWASNLTVGDGDRPYGFQDAAQKVQVALADYLERNPVSGNVRMWTAGFSRGGAVANITAADCIESGKFDAVYAYTFATPRTTKTPINYPGIYCILQKNDVVPKIPLADWGYERFGTDLYLISAEIDIDSTNLVEKAQALYREMIDGEMVMNFELNYQLRTLLDYLCMIVPDATTYKDYMQPLIVDILTGDDGTTDALMVLLEALQRYSLSDTQHGEELKAMLEYLETLINIYYLKDGIGNLPADKWDPQMGTYNLFNEHFPFEYLALMSASNNPEDVFSANGSYVRLVIYGKTDAEILDGERLIKTILADGTELVDGVKAHGSMPYVECSEDKMVITLPADHSYTVRITSKATLPQTVVYTGLLYGSDKTQAQADDMYSYLMSSGETAEIRTSSNGRAIEPESSAHTDVTAYVGTIYSPTTAMRLENNSIVHLTISGLINKLLFIIALLLVQAIVSIILAVIRKKKHHKRHAIVALIWHSAIALVFAVLELAMWYFVPVLTIAKFIGGFLVYLTFVIYALKGYKTEKKNLKVFFILLGILTAYVILESLLIGTFATWKALVMLIFYVLVMVAAYIFLWRNKDGSIELPMPPEEEEIDDENVLRLIKKKKKGITGLIFSRMGLVILLILIEVGLMLGVFHWLYAYFAWFTVAQTIFAFVMVIYLFNCDMDATAKLTWMFLIMLLPLPATFFLWYTQRNVGHRMEAGRVKKMIYDSKDLIAQDESVISNPEIVKSGTANLCHYLNNSGAFPVWENTETTFFPLGENKFEAMLEELKKAENFIFMEYFIIDEGLMWGSILKILADKVAQGVDVRVMYDGMCEISTLCGDYPKRMEKLGIKCKPFAPIQPFISTHYNYRDHRKILVIDGKVAFNGGVNLADEYINRRVRFGHWKDTAVMLKGDAVQSFTLMFLQMWNLTEKEPKWDEASIRVPAASDGFVMPYCDCPLDDYKVGESVYIDILYRAKKYVHIMTPYLILDNELETALKFAAERGVDVKLILPGIPDKKAAYALAKSHYRSLVAAGVHIYEYTPGFVHAKVFVSDDEKAVVGTINMDYRSLYHHFECATYMFRTSCVKEIESDFECTLAKCAQVTEETIKKEKKSYKLIGSLMKLIAPLM